MLDSSAEEKIHGTVTCLISSSVLGKKDFQVGQTSRWIHLFCLHSLSTLSPLFYCVSWTKAAFW